VTPNRHGSAVIEFPNDLEIVTTREFDAPIELVFDVLTKPEHVSNWFAPFTCQVTECSIDLRLGGKLPHRFRDRRRKRVLVSGNLLGGRAADPDGRDVAVRRMARCGRPSSPWIMHETDGVTRLTMKLAFRDKAGRDHMTKSDGQEDSFTKMEDYLRSLLAHKGDYLRVVEVEPDSKA